MLNICGQAGFKLCDAVELAKVNFELRICDEVSLRVCLIWGRLSSGRTCLLPFTFDLPSGVKMQRCSEVRHRPVDVRGGDVLGPGRHCGPARVGRGTLGC